MEETSVKKCNPFNEELLTDRLWVLEEGEMVFFKSVAPANSLATLVVSHLQVCRQHKWDPRLTKIK